MACIALTSCNSRIASARVSQVGWGALVAKGSFKQGDVILLEEAILSLAAGASPVAALGLLSRSQRRRLAALHCHTRLAPARAEDGAGALSEQLGEEGERLLEEMVASGVWTAEQAVQDAGWLWQLLRVWDANKLSFVTAQGPEQCVFERISRLNHSCEPNVRLLPAGPKQLLVVAAVDIREGEELCICYPERNILPMLHFLHAPTSWRRRTLERWQFLCRCVRCEAPRPEQEARALVSPLQAATSSEDFPIDQVLQLLSQCQDAGLGCDHWLSFWLLSLCMVGSSARPLQVASHGVARASHLPVLPGSLQPLAERCPNAAQLLAQGDRGAGTAPRPGVTARLTSYFSFKTRTHFFCRRAALMDGERTCLICSREICSPDSAAHILPCSHAQWHESCIHQWLTRQRTCPLCRTPSQVAVVEEPPTAIGMAQDLLGRMQDLLDEEDWTGAS
eukprot:g33770.t1